MDFTKKKKQQPFLEIITKEKRTQKSEGRGDLGSGKKKEFRFNIFFFFLLLFTNCLA